MNRNRRRVLHIFFVGILISSILSTNSVQAQETAPILLEGKVLEGVSRSVDASNPSECSADFYTKRYTACLGFTDSKPKQITIYATFKTNWITLNSSGDFVPWRVGQTKFTGEREVAEGKVISFTETSITFEFTPLMKGAAKTFNIAYSADGHFESWKNTQAIKGFDLWIVTGKDADAKILLDCPTVAIIGEENINVIVKSNIPVTFRYSLNSGIADSHKDEFREVSSSNSSDNKSIEFTVKVLRRSTWQSVIYVSARSILNQPYSIELSPAYCQIKVTNASVPNRNYDWSWSDGSQASSKQYSLDNLKAAFLDIKYVEKDSQGKKLQVQNYSVPNPVIIIDVLYEGKWYYHSRLAFSSKDNVVEGSVELDWCKTSICLGSNTFRLVSDDGKFYKEVKVTISKGFFDFNIKAPPQVEWGKYYKVSIKANKSVNGTCSYSTFHRGRIEQGSSKLVNGVSTKSVQWFWGDAQTTVVEVGVTCVTKGYSVTKTAYIRGFKS
jgi:hypothetical protein